jgi:hypothetical protein
METIGRKALNYINYIKNTETVIDKGEEKERRIIKEIYKNSIANFASIYLGTSYSLYIK